MKIFSPFCGDDINTYPAPDWLRAVVPNAAQVFGAERFGAVERVDASIKPITFVCLDCGGGLKITSEQDCLITCSYCDSDCYLPDGLWRRLHFLAPLVTRPAAHSAMRPNSQPTIGRDVTQAVARRSRAHSQSSRPTKARGGSRASWLVSAAGAWCRA